MTTNTNSFQPNISTPTFLPNEKYKFIQNYSDFLLKDLYICSNVNPYVWKYDTIYLILFREIRYLNEEHCQGRRIESRTGQPPTAATLSVWQTTPCRIDISHSTSLIIESPLKKVAAYERKPNNGKKCISQEIPPAWEQTHTPTSP